MGTGSQAQSAWCFFCIGQWLLGIACACLESPPSTIGLTKETSKPLTCTDREIGWVSRLPEIPVR